MSEDLSLLIILWPIGVLVSTLMLAYRAYIFYQSQKPKIIFKCIAGSRMYGVHGPKSDYDVKVVYLLPFKDRLKPPKRASYSIKVNDEVTEEWFHLEAFLKLLEEGQTLPLEMLFCPKECIIETSPLWEKIKSNRDKFIHSNITAFFSMARSQALKYSDKGNRIQAFLSIRSLLEKNKSLFKKLKDIPEIDLKIDQMNYKTNKGEKLIKLIDQKGEKLINVCGTKIGYSHKIEGLIEIIDSKLKVYGQRSIEAFKNDSVDYKALSHCLRVAIEAKELLLDHKISLPLKEKDKDLVLSIKNGKMKKEDILKLVDKELNIISELEKTTSLKKEPDHYLLNKIRELYKTKKLFTNF